MNIGLGLLYLDEKGWLAAHPRALARPAWRRPCRDSVPSHEADPTGLHVIQLSAKSITPMRIKVTKSATCLRKGFREVGVIEPDGATRSSVSTSMSNCAGGPARRGGWRPPRSRCPFETTEAALVRATLRVPVPGYFDGDPQPRFMLVPRALAPHSLVGVPIAPTAPDHGVTSTCQNTWKVKGCFSSFRVDAALMAKLRWALRRLLTRTVALFVLALLLVPARAVASDTLGSQSTAIQAATKPLAQNPTVQAATQPPAGQVAKAVPGPQPAATPTAGQPPAGQVVNAVPGPRPAATPTAAQPPAGQVAKAVPGPRPAAILTAGQPPARQTAKAAPARRAPAIDGANKPRVQIPAVQAATQSTVGQAAKRAPVAQLPAIAGANRPQVQIATIEAATQTVGKVAELTSRGQRPPAVGAAKRLVAGPVVAVVTRRLVAGPVVAAVTSRLLAGPVVQAVSKPLVETPVAPRPNAMLAQQPTTRPAASWQTSPAAEQPIPATRANTEVLGQISAAQTNDATPTTQTPVIQTDSMAVTQRPGAIQAPTYPGPRGVGATRAPSRATNEGRSAPALWGSVNTQRDPASAIGKIRPAVSAGSNVTSSPAEAPSNSLPLAPSVPGGLPAGSMGSAGALLLITLATLALGLLAGLSPALRKRLRIPPAEGPLAIFTSPLERPG